MIHPPRGCGPDPVTDALHVCAGKVERIAPAGWRFALHNGKPLSVEASLGGPWLRLTTSLRLRQTPDWCWRLLAVNAQLPAGARLALLPGRAIPALLVDVFIEDDGAVTRRTNDACAVLTEAADIVAALRADSRGRGAEPAAAGARTETSASISIGDLISEAGWPNKPLAQGTVEVPIEARGGPYAALVEPHLRGLRASIDIVDGTLSPPSREAVGAMTLAASAVLRGVRAAAEPDESSGRIRFEALLPPTPNVAECDRTLGSLASAGEHFGPEAQALAAASLAREYLRMMGRPQGAATGMGTLTEMEHQQTEPVLQGG